MTWKISPKRIKEIISESKESVWEPFPGITIVAWQLPNGFVISDQSGCIDPDDYNREIGIDIARNHLEDKVWHLYGFMRKQEFSDAKGGGADDQNTKTD